MFKNKQLQLTPSQIKSKMIPKLNECFSLVTLFKIIILDITMHTNK